jgi:hypothetical protein
MKTALLLLAFLVSTVGGTSVFAAVNIETLPYQYNAPEGGEAPAGDPGRPVALDFASVAAHFNSYMASHGETFGAYTLGYNGCTTLTAYFIGQYTTLPYGHGNGSGVAKNLGIGTTSTPTPPAIFSVAAGVRTWGASGGIYGHTGIVLEVRERMTSPLTTVKEARVIHTGSSRAKQARKYWDNWYPYPMPGVSFANVGRYLKSGIGSDRSTP